MSTTEIDLDTLATLIADKLGEREAKPEPRYVDAATAAEAIGVPDSWLMSQARARRCPHRRIGKYVRFSIPELVAWTDEQHARGPKGAKP